jgi:hypothetical protein
MESEEFVTITRKEYESLLDDSAWRSALECGGVDNWPYYYDSLKDAGYFEDEDE